MDVLHRGGGCTTTVRRCPPATDVAHRPSGPRPRPRQARWEATLPRLATDVPGLGDAVARAGYDLGALRIFDPLHPEDPVVAAGAPWFMTLFGRDSLITSWMALVLDPRLALATVRTLARLQGTKTDPLPMSNLGAFSTRSGSAGRHRSRWPKATSTTARLTPHPCS